MDVTELPRALAPWAGPLALFPRDLALAMAPLLPRLAGLLGRSGLSPGDAGEPNGFDGIARRGPYERLLASEWLLLSELPEEFLRRVAASEHAFLRLSRRPPPAGRDIVALFDAGPDQLGVPRIVHMAILIVLAARAARERGSLSWGLLQDESASLHTGLTVASVRAFLESASPRHVTGPEAASWLAAPRVMAASERWLVGAEDLRPAPSRRSASALIVTEPLERDAPHLDVTALAAGDPRGRSARVDRPRERLAVRLLRDPFEAAVAPQVRVPRSVGVDVDAGLVLAQNGRRLYMRGRAGELISLVIPSSPRMPVPPAAIFTPPSGRKVIAVNNDPSVRRTVAVCPGAGRYFTYQLTKTCRRASKSDVEYTWQETAPSASSPVPFPLVPEAGRLRALWFPGPCFFDAQGLIVQLLPGSVARLATGEYAKCPWDTEPPSALPFASIPKDADVFGVFRDPATREVTHAIVVDGSRCRLELFTGARSELLRRTASPIRHVAVLENPRMIAYLTETAEVGVYAVSAGTMVLSTSAGEAP